MLDTVTKKEKLCAFMVKHRFVVLILTAILLIIFAFGIPKIKTEVRIGELFPYNHSYLKLLKHFSQVFGSGGSRVVIAVKAKQGDIFNKETLGKVKQITKEIELWREVYRALTVSIASFGTRTARYLPGGELIIEPLMWPSIPETKEEMDQLKKNIFSSPALCGRAVASDGSAALIVTEMKEEISYDRIHEMLRKLSETYSDEKTSIHIVGFPPLMGWIYSHKTQMYWVFGISVVLMIVILYIVFGNLMGMITPIVMSAICTTLGLGFIGFTGINFSPLQYILAFLVGARVMSNAVQITSRYIEEATSTKNKKESARLTMNAMLMPNASAVATDAAGFLILGVAQIALMQMVAVLMSFWMLTILLEGILVPIICSYLPLGANVTRVSGRGERHRWLSQINASVANFSMTVGKYPILILVSIILVIGIWQTSKLKVGDSTPGSPLLWPDHTYNIDQAAVDSTFNASSENFVLYYEGAPESVYEPFVLRTFEEFDMYMGKKLPDIYKSSMSLLGMTKLVRKTLMEGDPVWSQLPHDEGELRGIIGMVRKDMDPSTLRRFIDPEKARTHITLFFSDHTSDNMLRIREAAYDFFKEHPAIFEKGEFKLGGGRIGMEIALNEEMAETHALIDGLVIVTIFLVCSISFRSFAAGLMLTFPLVFANIIAFSYMSMTDIGLTTSTLPCSAVGVGLGVDFAIYLYSRCIWEYPRRNGWVDTVISAVKTTGKGIVYTGVTLILPILTWYFLSDLKFQAQMGFFLSMLLFTNMLLAFTLHPLLIILVKPKFMKRGVRTPAIASIKERQIAIGA